MTQAELFTATIHHYPRGSVIADGLRALAGLAMTFGPLAVFNVGSVMDYILAGLGALFLLFGFRTVLRYQTHVELSAGEIRIAGPVGRAIQWRDLDGMSVRYYTTMRDKLDGWMLLKMQGNGSVVTMDSTLEGFDDIVRHALAVARAKGITLEVGTLTNLQAMKIDEPGNIDEVGDIDAP